MGFDVFYSSVTGYKNIIKNKTSQDYCTYEIIDDGIIVALADGHSTDFFEYSHIGAKFACIAAIEILKLYINRADLDLIYNDLDSKKIQKDIYYKWKELIDNYHKKNNPVVLKLKYEKYSSTLAVVLVNKYFKLYLNIGDSFILVRKNENYIKVLDNNDSILVKSLGWKDAYKNIDYYFEKTTEYNKDEYTIIFSDGYSNGFDNYDDMILDLNNTISSYSNNIFSKFNLINNYGMHLEKISRYKSYDDITVIFFKYK